MKPRIYWIEDQPLGVSTSCGVCIHERGQWVSLPWADYRKVKGDIEWIRMAHCGDCGTRYVGVLREASAESMPA